MTRIALLLLASLSLLAASCANLGPGQPRSADTNPETGTHGGGNAD